ncbi:hypothetical protein RI054_35g135010 [Pseudoscourfieldia marina]
MAFEMIMGARTPSAASLGSLGSRGAGEEEVPVSTQFAEWSDALFAGVDESQPYLLKDNFDISAKSEGARACLSQWARTYQKPSNECIEALQESVLRLAERLNVSVPRGGLHVETFQSEYLAPRALALWFSRLDEDNWFSFEKATEAADRLTSQRGIRLVLIGGVCKDLSLPLVVNANDETVTAFTLALND